MSHHIFVVIHLVLMCRFIVEWISSPRTRLQHRIRSLVINANWGCCLHFQNIILFGVSILKILFATVDFRTKQKRPRSYKSYSICTDLGPGNRITIIWMIRSPTNCGAATLNWITTTTTTNIFLPGPFHWQLIKENIAKCTTDRRFECYIQRTWRNS